MERLVEQGASAEPRFYVPTGESTAEFTEKRSRFIGHVFPVTTKEEAQASIEAVKKRHFDARHNCWCYLIRDTGIVRYSDDGEPQGTAGQPILGVFQKGRLENLCCVVTRYFGGILLGAGGLVRAYTRAAKDALDAAGVSAMRQWTDLALRCPYALLDRVKLEVEDAGGVLGETTYTADVTLHALLPADKLEAFSTRITDLTAGGIIPVVAGHVYRAVPVRMARLP